MAHYSLLQSILFRSINFKLATWYKGINRALFKFLVIHMEFYKYHKVSYICFIYSPNTVQLGKQSNEAVDLKHIINIRWSYGKYRNNHIAISS